MRNKQRLKIAILVIYFIICLSTICIAATDALLIIETPNINKLMVEQNKSLIAIPHVLSAKYETIQPLDCESGIFQDEYICKNGEHLAYRIRIPENATVDMPLIIWLHGMNQYHRALHNNMGVIKKAEELNENRFIIIQPSSALSWYRPDTKELMFEFVDAMVEKYQIDENRVILVGYSLGAIGAWQYAEHNPDKWAAVVPVSSQPFIQFDKLVNAKVPIWAFWSNWDTYDNRAEMKDAVVLMKNSGTHLDVRCTEIEGVTHSDMAFTPFTEEFFDWAFEQKR